MLPGIGYRFAGRELRAGVSVEPTILGYGTKGTITQGTVTADVSAAGYGFGVDIDAFACLRIDRASSR